MNDGPSWLLIAATVALDLGLATMLGSVASSVWLRRARSVWGQAFGRRSRSFLLLATSFTAVAMIALLVVQTSVMADVALRDVGSELGSVLGSTQIGHAWLAAAPCLLLVLIASAASLRSPSPWLNSIAALALVALIGCRAAASHAAIHGPVSLAVAVEALHLLLIGLWIGMVLMTAVALDTASVDGAGAGGRGDASIWITQLSATATLVLAGIVSTGLANAWRGMGAISDLASTDWGRLLVLKLLFVGIAILLGGWNRMVTMPALLPALKRADASVEVPLRRFVGVARLEAVVLVVALIFAAVLAASAPPVAA